MESNIIEVDIFEITDERYVKKTDESYVKKSSTSGLIKNDGTIDTNDYLTEQEVMALIDLAIGDAIKYINE